MVARRARGQGLRAVGACGLRRLRTLTTARRRAGCGSGQSRPAFFKDFIMENLFITEALRAQLLANGRLSLDTPDFDPAPVVKLFTPDAGATWLLTELDPRDPDIAFGLCDLGLGSPELGYVSLAELATVRGRCGLPVERDLHFVADKRLSAYARDARLAERIVT
jgi:hypothetical protein